MSILFESIKTIMEKALDDTVQNKLLLERIHATIAAAVGLSNDCDSKTIFAEAENMMKDNRYIWLLPIYDKYIHLLNSTLNDEEYQIISSILQSINENEEDQTVKLETTEPVETVEETPKKYNWEKIIEKDIRGEYIWITWEKGIPKNKYKLYRNGIIVNSLDGNPLTISKTNRFKLSSTMCSVGDRTSSINKFRDLNYYVFIEYVENKYPGFLMSEIINEAKQYESDRKTNRKTTGNGVKHEDRIELSDLFTKKIQPIPEGGHYRQLNGKQFGLTGCYAINKYGYVMNRESKEVINAIDKNGTKYITIEGTEFEFNKLMLGAFRIDDPKTKDVEKEFLMRDLMIPIDWIEGIPSSKYIYIKGKGIYNTINKAFVKITNPGGENEYFGLTDTLHKPYKQKGESKIGKRKEPPKMVKMNPSQFIAEAEKRMNVRDNICDNNNDMT